MTSKSGETSVFFFFFCFFFSEKQTLVTPILHQSQLHKTKGAYDNGVALICNVDKITFVYVYIMHIHFFFFFFFFFFFDTF